MAQQVDHKKVEASIKSMTKAELKEIIHQLAAEAINQVQPQEDVVPYSGTRIGFVQ